MPYNLDSVGAKKQKTVFIAEANERVRKSELLNKCIKTLDYAGKS